MQQINGNYYGKYVNYMVKDAELQDALTKEGIKWRIFYAGNEFTTDNTNRIYLISSDYIPYDCLPSSVNGTKLNKGSLPNSVYFKDIVEGEEYIGSDSISDKKIQNLNSKFFKYLAENNTTSTYPNIKAVAYMLDTNVWNSYKGERAEFAIGGPTIELLFNSYHQTNNDIEVKLACTSKYGYELSDDNGAIWRYELSNINDYNSLYYITSPDNTKRYYWLASPSAYNTQQGYYICGMCSDGRLCCVSYYNFNGYNPHVLEIRPVICLNADVSLEKNLDETFEVK